MLKFWKSVTYWVTDWVSENVRPREAIASKNENLSIAKLRPGQTLALAEAWG